jgi:IS30 family transposase
MKRSVRRPGGKAAHNGQSHIPAMVNISERPAEAEDRAVPGHWEGDLLYGQGPGVVATLVERHSRFVMLVGLPQTHQADVVAAALAAKIAELPEHLRRSLTWDQGREMGPRAIFTVASGVPVYFCDPRSPWQRGSNENTNGLLRQYLPRKSRLGDRTQPELDAIAHELNGRPRQTLGWMTPSQALDRTMRSSPEPSGHSVRLPHASEDHGSGARGVRAGGATRRRAVRFRRPRVGTAGSASVPS